MTRVFFASPIPEGANPAIDTILKVASGALMTAGIDLRILNDDTLFSPDHQYPTRPILQALDAGADAIGFYVTDVDAGREAVVRARAAGIPIVTVAKPSYPVNASLNYPGFNHGMLMMQFLLGLLPEEARVGVIGGPDALTDAEAVAGLVFAAGRAGKCRLVNDPTLAHHCNLTDDRSGGREAGLRFLREFSELDGLIPYNDETMLGVLDAMDELGMVKRPLMVSRNGTPAAVAEVRAGRTAGTWDLDVPGVGRALADLFIAQLSANPPHDDHSAMAPVGRVINATNCGSWVPWEDRAPLGPLRFGLSG